MHNYLIYYQAGVVAVSDSPVESLAGCSLSQCTTIGAGPDGGRGVVFMDADVMRKQKARCGYFPDAQTWTQAATDIWVGVVGNVTPQDFARPEMINGHYVELNDGNEWLVPTARIFPEGNGLPESLRIGINGQIIRDILPKYAALGDKVERIWQSLYAELGWSGKEDDFEFIETAEAMGLACSFLSLNYRIGKEEASALRLFSDVNLSKALGAVVDFPTFEAAMKSIVSDDEKKTDSSTIELTESNDGSED